jgi:hypothetical protein|nr:MAG TPA: Putative transferase, nesg, ydcK, Structural Genomics.38A [Caudoviricetes sp.]
MIKKYEIITVGAAKRIKALRSFRVQDRFVNIGDVGGIVYDENTLSQEGNCWIFSGNLGYASIRVGGDSIVDTNGYEGAVTDPRPFVNITGTSALIGAHEFVTGKASARKTLAASDMEVGGALVVVGKTYEESKESAPAALRVKATLYRGGTKTTVKATNPDYQIKVLRYDVNGLLFSASPNWITGGPDISVATEDCYYYAVLVRKTTGGNIAVADITTAAVEVSEPVTEGALNINDSRLEFNYTSAMTVATKVNAGNTQFADVYKSVIDGSNLTISKTGAGAFAANILADVIKCNVEWRLISKNSLLIGNFYNIGRLVNDGSYSFAVSYVTKNKIIARDCYAFTQSEQVIPKDALSALSVSFPFKFIRCNVEKGIFYHNPVNRNVYTDIDFSKASADLGKALIFGTLCSSEVEGMYRVYHVASKKFGALVESYDSIKDANFSDLETMVATTIYKDAKLTGLFSISGTNVFGGTGNHGGGKGCEITNTKKTAMVISGNVRVEGNAKVKDTRIAGTGYFGGNSVTENAYIFGSAYVTDNGVFSPAPEEGKFDSDIHIEDNAKFLATSRSGNNVVYMCGDSEFSGALAFNTLSLAMYGKSRIAGKVSGRGVLILEDNADTSDKNVGVYGCIRLVGNYRQTKEKIWTGRRTISSENEPTYDNNVKTKYDF